ncbi:MAG: ABC-F family ATP-binding cassette domain-containing protein, partial [Anaerolineae bacterium]
MTLLLASHLSKYFGAEAVFVDLSCAVHPGEIIAFVGANGSGKSTLLEILAGRMEPDEGNVARARNTRLGYLPQTPDFRSDGTLWQAMEAVFAPLLRQARELRNLEELMASGHGIERDEAIERYGILLDAFERAGGFTYEAQISRVLGGLGFDEEEFHTPVDHLSGGEKTRALLARLLLEEPDLLLLDEPTNHLDLEGIEWLEEQLKSWKGSMVIVAHDRAFLDALADRVWELQASSLESYRGNYTAYVQQREERRARKLAAYEAQQAHIAKTEDYIRRYMAGQRSAQAKGRLKRLEREERLKPPPEAPQNLHLDLETTLRSGDLVLGLYDLEVGYEEHHSLVTVDE